MSDSNRNTRLRYPQGRTDTGVDVDMAVTAQGRQIVDVEVKSPKIVAFQALTITATAGFLTAEATGDSGPRRSFRGTLLTAQVNWRGDSTAPTSTTGEPIEVGDIITLDEDEIKTVQFVRTGGTSGVLRGHFYNVLAKDLP